MNMPIQQSQTQTGANPLPTVLAIWAEVLKQPAQNEQADFFDAGGNSMLLIAILNLIHERLDREISPAALVHGITPARLAELAA
ncbi:MULTISPECIES: acyl carrier protein [unclassified Pseudomonas]|jgi:hypothetical protein|uniref:acyl carrier protein n=1 Tax=unclassified Pseudomonas TaxID=196821 RepID=UPI002AC8D6FB|nr:acyl carrier protein [Pseudomonas sp. MH9.3]MEB0107381.1 acyl carrier protein [Pseudomonas sp. MH9.3]WPX81833.1 acyl carrier protein [Pseudomonas sp. MH9.3]WQG56679.1 acyl carrier protein [Pseudomonas sp. RTB3]